MDDRLRVLFDRSIPEPNSGCWLWVNATTPAGYGQVKLPENRKLSSVHRLSYEIVHGPIPAGLQIDHKCRVRCCINPNHLRAVTIKTNVLAGEGFAAVNARKTHCVNGHEFNEQN